ncbi:hypothetical protein [Hymenobacter jeongseonensis]|nr:hypothetical protein [Hymenobacter jeongseonensis]
MCTSLVQPVRKTVGTRSKLVILAGLLLAGRLAQAQSGAEVLAR